MIHPAYLLSFLRRLEAGEEVIYSVFRADVGCLIHPDVWIEEPMSGEKTCQ